MLVTLSQHCWKALNWLHPSPSTRCGNGRQTTLTKMVHPSHEVCQALMHCKYWAVTGFMRSITTGFYDS
ncbi:hypothetical protein N8561_01305 [bacterium]|nr:hypothetical protein [bacterium]